MSIRKVSFVEEEYYHIYNRGNDKREIFHDAEDYQRFLNLLFLSNSATGFRIHFIPNDVYSAKRGDPLVAVGAYCLMPNHFHLLITQIATGGITKFMQKVSTGYSMYYNKKYKRTGSLFEGKFKSEYANSDPYLKYLFSYIHLNPIKLIDPHWKERGIADKSKSLDFLSKYTHSSYQDYAGIERPQKALLAKDCFPDYFPNPQSFSEEILDWLTLQHT